MRNIGPFWLFVALSILEDYFYIIIFLLVDYYMHLQVLYDILYHYAVLALLLKLLCLSSSMKFLIFGQILAYGLMIFVRLSTFPLTSALKFFN